MNKSTNEYHLLPNGHARTPKARNVIKVINMFGGVNNLAKILNRQPCSIYKWTHSIPAEDAWSLLAYSMRNNIPITLQDFRPELDFKPRLPPDTAERPKVSKLASILPHVQQ